MKDAEFTSYTIIEFPSEAEMEFFLSERISKSASLRDRMKKSGMKKWVTSRTFNKDNKFVKNDLISDASVNLSININKCRPPLLDSTGSKGNSYCCMMSM